MEVKPGDLINFFALKKNVYEKKGEKIIQAEGNIVIIHQNSTIYGDECLMNFATGTLEMHGNVRLVGKELNLYGTDIFYNAKTKLFTVENAKLFTAKYSFVAKKITKINDVNYVAEESEFTTCLDCPESWSVFASRVDITINQYVKAKNAMFKIKGADSFYLPYVLFPIKKERESGLLFPHFGTRFAQGFYFEQPFFWNISPHQDMTISPAFWTKRGYSTHVEYRWLYDFNSWIKLDNTYMNDRIYSPNKENDDPNGQKYFRFYHLLDLGYRPNHDWNLQLSYNDFRDLDMYRDFNQILTNRVYGAETGIDAFMFWKNTWSEVNLQALVPNSLLRTDENSDRNVMDRDPTAVATLPKLSWDLPTRQFKWSNGSLFPQMTLKIDTETTKFAQNHASEDSTLRNAQRSVISPRAKFFWWHGDIFQLSSTLNQDYAHYNFRDDRQDNFSKMQLRSKSSFSFEVAKIYGVSSVRPGKQIASNSLTDHNDHILDKNYKKIQLEENMLITALPAWQKRNVENQEQIVTSSYRHISRVDLNHYYLFEEKLAGNQQFSNQLQSLDGWFDYRDALFDREYAVASEEFQTLIPMVNTLELAWDNQLIKKSPKQVNFNQDYIYNQEQFNFGRVAFISFSQGLRLKKRYEEDDFSDSLTRLKSQIGSSLHPYAQVSLTDYYFHSNHKHIWSLSLVNSFPTTTLTHALDSNDFNGRKTYNLTAEYQISDPLKLIFKNNRDLTTGLNLTQSYGFNYISPSNCWMMNLMYLQALNDEQIRFDFAFYFGEQAVL